LIFFTQIAKDLANPGGPHEIGWHVALGLDNTGVLHEPFMQYGTAPLKYKIYYKIILSHGSVHFF